MDKHIGARADAAAAETALDLRSRRREGGRQGRCDIGETPCRRGVPDVLDRGTIVDVEPIEHVDPADLRRVGVANIGVVEKSVLSRLVVGSLHEGAEIAVDLAAIEQAHLLHDEIVVRVGDRIAVGVRRRRILLHLGLGEGRQQHRGDRRRLFDRHAAAHRIAAELEAATEGSQLRKGRVTGGAGLAGLPGEAWNGFGRTGCESQAQRDRAHEAHYAEDEKRRDIRFPPVETRIGHGILQLLFCRQ